MEHFLVNYIGHGGTGWAHEQILTVPAIQNWDNNKALPVFMLQLVSLEDLTIMIEYQEVSTYYLIKTVEALDCLQQPD